MNAVALPALPFHSGQPRRTRALLYLFSVSAARAEEVRSWSQNGRAEFWDFSHLCVSVFKLEYSGLIGHRTRTPGSLSVDGQIQEQKKQ